ncbi:exodeoxyribonuclease VII large subunit [Tuwongella immobilis]|uniref:Exodeoxyribonuclease 7 large subunit n=1 Tax=Tuwongella immobilis TaxID=692036 RepID=A0A6C2YMT1_9BACT|nr:exodeoxyribonuclease VII large subunit [Tuwongella immobilis]VIP02684.1 exodeoxyribonuclease vii large subunit : Exonuclease VII large subunit OS=uncultured archaeon GZfos19C8 GN=GZ19C8_15 PE=3 SV=1: tRNA_anti_2: Exonuc_VII_L [Tuwongella immobilis]VTS02141.1 exodeoxyribonuclease vii large subunit : Exonuclease VII large subunit OS=uncultured archaeon GZfos19C8 GN=GZ19C8_15 PE=3 SV=1: tRNA_anti_2: Exonuc_VII_L [Tuwongella immobilis]
MALRELPPDIEVMTVGDLTRDIRRRLEAGFPAVWVSGEISSLSKPSSGHWYLNLRDKLTTLACVFYRGMNLRVRFEPKDGMEVVCRGKITVYEPRGNYQFLIEEMHPKGIGAAELALQQLKEKLLQRGYFDPQRKRPIAKFPERIALVTSPTGAAVRDMLEILGKRWPATEVVIRGVRVQGDPAPDEIASAIALLNRLHRTGVLPLDTIILGRGGGSSEDLDAFNSEKVADALFLSQVPTIAAVGHEIDVTIADLVADQRAATPSQAATLATPDRAEIAEYIKVCDLRLKDRLQNRLKLATTRLNELANRGALRRPLERIREWEQRLDERSERLHRSIQQRLRREHDRLAALSGKIATLSPLNVLARGYSLTRTIAESSPDGRIDSASEDPVIRSIDTLHEGQLIRTTLASGEIISRIERLEAPTLEASVTSGSGMTVAPGTAPQ